MNSRTLTCASAGGTLRPSCHQEVRQNGTFSSADQQCESALIEVQARPFNWPAEWQYVQECFGTGPRVSDSMNRQGNYQGLCTCTFLTSWLAHCGRLDSDVKLHVLQWNAPTFISIWFAIRSSIRSCITVNTATRWMFGVCAAGASIRLLLSTPGSDWQSCITVWLQMEQQPSV